ncbi:hypothetical protein LVJ85_02255 [Neisseria sp. Dent CA1/247]|uniref:hypothetical protein n=1 Tax=Neisseria sp. Dent CA1/247 TaxID=2912675 RepID=UPI001FD24472|nr:hypothetical protein [Neisseria sp. Dent CA1/247]UOO77344.1 hypothetical protein LVJ85_02255 [Neisseria sp. Dent CA1/247]
MAEYQIIISETESGKLQVKIPLVSVTPESSISELVAAYLAQVAESIEEDENEDPNGIKKRIYQQLMINALT